MADRRSPGVGRRGAGMGSTKQGRGARRGRPGPAAGAGNRPGAVYRRGSRSAAARSRYRGRLARPAALCGLRRSRAPDRLDSRPRGSAGSAGRPRRGVQLGHAQFPGRAAAGPGGAGSHPGAAGYHRDANDDRIGRLSDLHAPDAEARCRLGEPPKHERIGQAHGVGNRV
ncbi:hypothetical protein NSMM_510039 [Nitrosomonas mobilis]|uniref:Uncharacterized protein n=1 Tax=Nitrosomonas mobilis TaxID=51642 RepID=A0A1G5SIE4_9PROT|nr:hypothetical protein NSMM_510039 [Nitrosomonas mobilis]